MFERFKRNRERRRANAAIVDALFGSIASAARQPLHYTRHGLPDTIMGRFEMMTLHMWLFQHRAKGSSAAVEALAQDVVDVFFREVDHTLREIGIGDTSVPKRMKKLARMVYGRWEAYGGALAASDIEAMTDAVLRNVFSEGGDATCARTLAEYAFAVAERLGRQPDEALLGGRVEFPVAPAAAAA